MLYCNYEKYQIQGPYGPIDLVKLVFKSSVDPSAGNWMSSVDKSTLQTCVTILKQIPAGKRSYDPSNHVWTIPAAALNTIELYLVAYGGALLEHQNLFVAMQPKTEQTAKHWAEDLRASGKVKAEATEDFFKNSAPVSSGTLDSNTLQQRLILLIKPYISFDLNDRESFLRGYKIAARKLHPDLGGDAAKMSELNSLFMQYKEVMR